MKRILFLTDDEALRTQVNPMAQWLELHAPPSAIDALEHIKSHQPDCFIVDAAALSPMVVALLDTLRKLPQYKSVPLILIGDSPAAKRLQPDRTLARDFNLRRLEEAIAELLNTRLIGRGSHGPHHGSVY